VLIETRPPLLLSTYTADDAVEPLKIVDLGRSRSGLIVTEMGHRGQGYSIGLCLREPGMSPGLAGLEQHWKDADSEEGGPNLFVFIPRWASDTPLPYREPDASDGLQHAADEVLGLVANVLQNSVERNSVIKLLSEVSSQQKPIPTIN
jgi:hypothetical protein